jgi:GH15 family glucan-1,4-alpha-glucosidase
VGAGPAALDRPADPPRLQIMFGIGGERDLSERLLPHLSGWRGNGPVRSGNDAWEQRQLDVYGALQGNLGIAWTAPAVPAQQAATSA